MPPGPGGHCGFRSRRARSGMASAITSLVPIKYTLVRKEKGLTVYSCTGTPVDCVKLAINEVLERKPDLLAPDQSWWQPCHLHPVFWYDWGQLPKDACSVFLRWEYRSWIIVRMPTLRELPFRRMLARRIIKEGLPHGTYLNLNVPNVPNVKGMKVCRQADGRWTNEFKRSENAAGEPVFWLAGAFENANRSMPITTRWRSTAATPRLFLAR